MTSAALRLLLAAALGASIALAACGDDDDDGGGETVSAADYAADVCSSAREWATSLQSRAGDLAKTIDPQASPQAGKELLVGFLEDAVADTDEWIDALAAAGTPDVEGGEEAAEQLRKAAADSKEILERAHSQAEDLPTDDEQRFATEAGEVSGATRDSLSEVGDALSRPTSEELQTAFDEAEACKQAELGSQ